MTTEPRASEGRSSGPIDLTGVQNAMNKGIAGIKRGATEAASSLKNMGTNLKNTKVNNPVKVTKGAEFIPTMTGANLVKTKTRSGLLNDRKIIKTNDDNRSSRVVTNASGSVRKITSNEKVNGGVEKTARRYDNKGDLVKNVNKYRKNL
jgi:hypothetical protein